MKNKNTKSDNKTPDIRKTFNRIAIIQANWHADIVEEATKSFTKELIGYGYDADCFDIHNVPGSLEIPLMAQKLSETGQYDLVMAAGLIVDGGIYRHDFVARTVLDAMMRVQLDSGVPVLSVVLTPHHFQETDAHRNFFKKHFVIKGQEAAKACHQTLENMRGLKELRLAS